MKCPEKLKGLRALLPLFDFYFAEGTQVKAFKGLTEFNFTDQLYLRNGYILQILISISPIPGILRLYSEHLNCLQFRRAHLDGTILPPDDPFWANYSSSLPFIQKLQRG